MGKSYSHKKDLQMSYRLKEYYNESYNDSYEDDDDLQNACEMRFDDKGRLVYEYDAFQDVKRYISYGNTYTGDFRYETRSYDYRVYTEYHGKANKSYTNKRYEKIVFGHIVQHSLYDVDGNRQDAFPAYLYTSDLVEANRWARFFRDNGSKASWNNVSWGSGYRVDVVSTPEIYNKFRNKFDVDRIF